MRQYLDPHQRAEIAGAIERIDEAINEATDPETPMDVGKMLDVMEQIQERELQAIKEQVGYDQ